MTEFVSIVMTTLVESALHGISFGSESTSEVVPLCSRNLMPQHSNKLVRPFALRNTYLSNLKEM